MESKVVCQGGETVITSLYSSTPLRSYKAGVPPDTNQER